MRSSIFTIFFNIFLSLFCVSSAHATPRRVLLIRHAEKPNTSSPDLSQKGYERANALTFLFEKDPVFATEGLPVILYASKYSAGESANRCVETLTPLAQHLGVNLESPYLPAETSQMAQAILKDSTLDGKVVMVAWPHGEIVDLANALGSAPANKWKSSDFDRVWVLDYDSSGKVTSQDLPQNLLPGDSQK
jgi:hypothetical protein